MPKEINFQTKIVKRIKDEGGYGAKWSSQFTVGKPDLILIPKNFGTLFAEVKLEENWIKNTARTMGFTEKQKLEAKRINAVQNSFGNPVSPCIGLIVVYNGVKDVTLLSVPMPSPRNECQVRLSDVRDQGLDWYAKGYRLTDYLLSRQCW